MELIDLVKNWIKKADGDLKTAKDELNTTDPVTTAICFHAQQCVEKYLKTYLVFHKKDFKKIHDVAEHLELCKEIDGSFDTLREYKIAELTRYATKMRYGDDFHCPSKDEAQEAVVKAEKVKGFVLKKLEKEGLKL